jgi:hypothetical protein
MNIGRSSFKKSRIKVRTVLRKHSNLATNTFLLVNKITRNEFTQAVLYQYLQIREPVHVLLKIIISICTYENILVVGKYII